MKKRVHLLLAGLLPLMLYAQPMVKKDKYDITKDKVLYTIGYAHLDTEWNWDYPTSINTSIKNIMTENFHLFEKYPDYVFNFTGSRRYKMMQEYYPELFPGVLKYVKAGRWKISGSSVDEAEVNMSSSESLLRHVLYGNHYFMKTFGTASQDYMLPDCFGFLANTPSVWAHCGLLGFSTQKLTWHSAVGIPFNVGVWNGPDGKGVIAALNATSYSGGVRPRLDIDTQWVNRFDEDQRRWGLNIDYRYYGVGDQGGAPRERDVYAAVHSLHNPDSKIKVILTSSDQMYKDISPELRAKLPTYTGDLLLTEHSAGSLTSQSFMKRMNRKNELLAKAAEQSAVFADWTGASPYPSEKLANSWDLVLGSQDHDILPGTASPKAFEYAWNDEFIAANGFAETIKHSVDRLTSQMNTQATGRSLVVYNPVAFDREDVVTAELTYDQAPENVQVFDGKGKALPTQVIDRQGNKLKFVFLARVPSAGLAAFDVRTASTAATATGGLSVTDRSLENAYYKVTLDDKGNVTSLYDKTVKKELLAKPATLEFLHEAPTEWPAWNMDWADRKRAPLGYMDENASIKVIENGPVRVALEITRQGQNSKIRQIMSLAAGEAGKRLEIANKADWQSKSVSLEADFPLSVSNKMATYALGAGNIQRPNNDSVKYEVPAKMWFDITDQSGASGVSILEDCKYGSDKPADNELRLTLMYTPEANRGYRYQNTQDWGVHEFKYGVYGHKGGWENGSPWQGEFFNQPLLAFETPKHEGAAGKTMSFLTNTNPGVGVMAIKKAEDNDYYIVRVNELNGKDEQNLSLGFAGAIEDAYEVNGQEQKIGPAKFAKDKLTFDLSHYTIKSFAIKLAAPKAMVAKVSQQPVTLPYNMDVFSYDDNRDDGNFGRRGSIPAEMVPDEIVSEGVHFKLGSKADRENNAVGCRGQVINLPAGDYKRIYILGAAASEFTGRGFGGRQGAGGRNGGIQMGGPRAEFVIDGKPAPVDMNAWSGFMGQFYDRKFALDEVTVMSIDSAFSKQSNIAFYVSHTHQGYPTANVAYQYAYLFKYEIDIPNGAKSITLPNNNNIVIVGMTLTNEPGEKAQSLQPLYDDFKGAKPVSLR